jgi:hypothetical protein
LVDKVEAFIGMLGLWVKKTSREKYRCFFSFEGFHGGKK